ncbi:ABC transporter permease [Streptomyces radicis]|uniref:ABC transporter permease subunit n=1 Tax=Streptomyces radicis TaxID=1750517 RepID=A0A3A9VQT0_9ACTN|nr:ABC transporter permease subunit [Streptomyces radicis]RKN03471.1 ABC transporter permease subunit [Streptomyces radicis]RKN13333.1 ABC transporter permease subunit [Streptomyces radicis]
MTTVVRIRVLSVLAVALLWELLALSGAGADDFFPHLWTLAAAFGDVLTSDFAGDVGVTLFQLFWGASIGIVVGLVLGLLLATRPLVREIVEPLLVYLSTVPKIVLYPVFLLFLSVGTESKIAMAAFGAFFPVVLHTLGAVSDVRPVWLNAARLLHTSGGQRMRHVYIPAMAPTMFAGVRLGIATSIIGTVMAESKAADEGVGYRVIFYYSQYQIPQMYVVLLLVFVFSVLVAVGLDRLGRVLRLGGGHRTDREISL